MTVQQTHVYIKTLGSDDSWVGSESCTEWKLDRDGCIMHIKTENGVEGLI